MDEHVSTEASISNDDLPSLNASVFPKHPTEYFFSAHNNSGRFGNVKRVSLIQSKDLGPKKVVSEGLNTKKASRQQLGPRIQLSSAPKVTREFIG